MNKTAAFASYSLTRGILRQYVTVLITVLLVTYALFNLRASLSDTNISLLFLLIVLFCATTAAPGVTVFCGVISFLCYDYFLVEPVLSFTPGVPIKLLDPLAFLVVALVTGMLSERSRRHAVEVATYRQASQFRATLLHLISHNLRTPVATIKTALTTLLTLDDIQAAHRELVAGANQECDRLNRLIGNVLQLSRLDAHAVELHTDWNGLDEVISAVFSRWPEATADKRLTATIPQPLPLIRFDFALIESVLTNLVENAFRHGKPPIHVELKFYDAEVQVQVEDCGPGIAPSARTSLFQPFSMARSGGLGLGLAVCKGLIEAHQGRLWAEFVPGKTRFVFSLPLIVYKDREDEPDVDR
jgi:two-component system, OmpR family, sensor histidine kinase KdpD